MKKVTNECVGCPQELKHLCGSCNLKHVTRFYCDKCGNEDKLYHYEDEELCEECLLKEFDIVEGSDDW